MRKLTSLLLTLCMVLALTACGNKEKAAMESKEEVSTESEEVSTESEEVSTESGEAATEDGEEITFEKGSIDGDTYTNTSIGIKMTVPEGFEMADDDMMSVLEEGMQNSADQTGSADATAAMSYEFVMMTPDGTSLIQVAAEDMTKSIGMAVSAEIYIKSATAHAEAQYAAMGLTAEVESLGTVEIGGKEFEGMEVSVESGDIIMMQNYYIYRAGDVMFEIVVSYPSDTEETLEQFISSVEAVE